MFFRLSMFFTVFFITCSSVVFTHDSSSYSVDYRSGDRQYCHEPSCYMASGIRYGQEYTAMEAFYASRLNSMSVAPFVCLQGHIFNDGMCVTQAELEFRKVAGCRVCDFNTYYDFRDTKRINYNQTGIGLETSGNLCDVRLNGYVSLGNHAICPYEAKFCKFLGSRMIVSQKYKLLMDGTNAEFGFNFGTSERCDFYAAVGGYYVNGQEGYCVCGGKVRLVARFKKYLTLELNNSYDGKFHNRFHVRLSFNMPFGSAVSESSTYDDNCLDKLEGLLSGMVQSVERQEVVVAGHVKECSSALDPATNEL